VKILIAPDKFKGSLSAQEVCNAIGDALFEMDPSYEISQVPLADGGEGTFEILVTQSHGRLKKISVLDPLQRPIQAEYGLSKDGAVAFIEMAKASGLQLLKENERNPLLTSTIGTGQLILDALDEGATNIILGIGGSATSDAGIGMAHALGFRFLNEKKEILDPTGASLSKIDSVDDSLADARLGHVNFTVLCDVDNPLYGTQGAAYVYGPQKGASPQIVKELDHGLIHFADHVKTIKSIDLNFPGAGAAGGLGAGAKLFLHANFERGIDYICWLTGLEEKIKTTDMIITGEGKVDQQTFSGKVVAHVLDLANQYNKPVFILCGQCALTEDELKKFGADRIITLANHPSEWNAAIRTPIPLIKSRIKEAFLNLT
jgi:glycerate 2-kinase